MGDARSGHRRSEKGAGCLHGTRKGLCQPRGHRPDAGNCHKLGRLATGLGTDGERRGADGLPGLRVEVTVALEKIYGQAEPAPAGEIVDVEEVRSAECGAGKHLTLNPSPQRGEGGKS